MTIVAINGHLYLQRMLVFGQSMHSDLLGEKLRFHRGKIISGLAYTNHY